jgi:hypothetical protein
MHTLSKLELSECLKNITQKKEIFAQCIHIHQVVMKMGATPLKYMEFLRNYKTIMEVKIDSQGGQSNRLSMGLAKLQDGNLNSQKANDLIS